MMKEPVKGSFFIVNQTFV
ncbi:Protein of unknown function [Bacillus cereus]|nr:Protein of unknown function [Bacillus cereus]